LDGLVYLVQSNRRPQVIGSRAVNTFWRSLSPNTRILPLPSTESNNQRQWQYYHTLYTNVKTGNAKNFLSRLLILSSNLFPLIWMRFRLLMKLLSNPSLKNYDHNFMAASLYDDAYLDITEICKERSFTGGRVPNLPQNKHYEEDSSAEWEPGDCNPDGTNKELSTSLSQGMRNLFHQITSFVGENQKHSGFILRRGFSRRNLAQIRAL
ncbi:hypothetical protein Gorai_008689, partial [Gossypium raimondii]|nr:hypothetical protein [Gossypium raimondii]